jgi:hypothetical protein
MESLKKLLIKNLQKKGTIIIKKNEAKISKEKTQGG